MKVENYIGFASMIIALLSLYVSIRTVKAQNKHNALTLMPVCELYTANFDDSFAVEIKNKGLGMMHIEKISFVDEKNNVSKENLFDFIPNKQKLSYNRLEATANIMSGETIYLIKSKELSPEERKELVEILEKVVIYIEYSDVYKNKYEFNLKIEFLR